MINHKYVTYCPMQGRWTVFGDLTNSIESHIELVIAMAERGSYESQTTIYLETDDSKADIFVRPEIKQMFVFIHRIKIKGKWQHYKRENFA